MNWHFKTNLDAPLLPSGLEVAFDHIPQIGSRIAVPYHGYHIELEVVSIRYDFLDRGNTDSYHAIVELHIPRNIGASIREWGERMRACRDNEFKMQDR